MGEGPRGSNGACSTLCWISVTPSATYNQIGTFWCWFPSGWACACSRPLWVPPTTSPVRLGVSTTAASTPTGVFTQRFEALFPQAGALGCVVCFAPPPSSWSIYARMWGRGVCQLQPGLPRSTIRHLAGSAGHCLAASPLHPRCPSPPLLLSG